MFAVGTRHHARQLLWAARTRRPAPAESVGRPTRSSGRPTSPPPDYNFAAIPVVASRHPLWDQAAAARRRRRASTHATAVARPRGRRARDDTRSRAGCDAEPEADVLDTPGATPLPFLARGRARRLLRRPARRGRGRRRASASLSAIGALLRWVWRTESRLDVTAVAVRRRSPATIPVGRARRLRRRAAGYTAWWGMVVADRDRGDDLRRPARAPYFFLRASSPQWPPAGIEPPELTTVVRLHRRAAWAAASRSSASKPRSTAGGSAGAACGLARVSCAHGRGVPRAHRRGLPCAPRPSAGATTRTARSST